jgi:hemoglobin
VAQTAKIAPSRIVTCRSAVKTVSLFDKLGGKAGVNAAVNKFYEKVLADERVNEYFQSTNMAKQKAHQAAFMTFAFGGPNEYKGKDMAAAHKHLMPHLEESHFNAIVEHFVATLKELEVPQEDIDAAVAVVATTKEAVLS